MGRMLAEWHYFKLAMKFQVSNFEEENVIDLITWKRWISNALRRTHGVFGEGIEYEILNQESTRAYIQVSAHDKDIFSSAVSTYTSDSELVGSPVFVLILEESSDLTKMNLGDDDQLWLKKVLESNAEGSQCS